MDDNADATEVITQTVEALRLAGVNDPAIASSLIARGLLMRPMDGGTVEGVLGEVEKCWRWTAHGSLVGDMRTLRRRRRGRRLSCRSIVNRSRRLNDQRPTYHRGSNDSGTRSRRRSPDGARGDTSISEGPRQLFRQCVARRQTQPEG